MNELGLPSSVMPKTIPPSSTLYLAVPFFCFQPVKSLPLNSGTQPSCPAVTGNTAIKEPKTTAATRIRLHWHMGVSPEEMILRGGILQPYRRNDQHDPS